MTSVTVYDSETYNGCENIPCLGPKIWNMILSELKQMSSISTFKYAIKTET